MNLEDCPLCENSSEYKYRIEENAKRIESLETKINRNLTLIEERMDERIERLEKLLHGFILSALITVVSVVISGFI